MSEGLIGGDQTAPEVELGVTDDANQETGQQVGSPDLKTRVMEGGDFAWEQIQKRDRHSSELANRVKALEPIENLVTMAGGSDQLIEFAQLGSRVRQVPGLADVVQQALQTGRVDLPQQASQDDQDEDDEWLDPDAKKIRDSLNSKIADLEDRYAALQQVASGADLRSKESRVQKNIDTVLSEFEGNEDAFKEASQVVMDQYRAAQRAAESGDTVQAQLIDQLASEKGVEILNFVTMPVYKKHAAKLVSASNTSTAEVEGGLERKSTDERTVNPSRPGNPPMPPLPKGRVMDSDVQKYMEELARRKGYDLRLL